MTNQNSTETSQKPTDAPSIMLSKLDVASRQLETAITLYFQDADPVSIHTLASAAHEIIETLNAKNAGEPTIRQQFRNDIKPEYAKMFFEKLSSAKNFFKHADRDPEAAIEFSQFESEVVLLDACLTHKRLTKTRFPAPVMGTFLMWSALTWAREFIVYPGMDVNSPLALRMAGLPRAAFFAETLPIAQQAAAQADGSVG